MYNLAVLADGGWVSRDHSNNSTKVKVYSAILIPREILPLINMLTAPLIAPYRGANAF